MIHEKTVSIFKIIKVILEINNLVQYESDNFLFDLIFEL